MAMAVSYDSRAKCSKSLASRAAWRTGCLSSAHRRRYTCGALLATLGMLQLHDGVAFIHSEAIDVVITSGDSITIPFSGTDTDAFAISLQQCAGNAYLRTSLGYNGTTLYENAPLDTNYCNRIVAENAASTADDIAFDELCTFSRSAAVDQGYTRWSKTINNTEVVNPGDLVVTVSNPGDTTIAAQVLMYTEDNPAPDIDASIDRVEISVDQDQNTFTVDIDFQAILDEDESFCGQTSGCAVSAYYVEVDVDDEEEDLDFATTCQAFGGTVAYEAIVTTDSTMAESAYTTSACVELPQRVEATYRVYVVVSPDTESYSRVGYGLRDQLVYASDVITVDGDANESCPEDDEETDDDTSGGLKSIIPVRASSALTLGLAAVVLARGF